MKEDTLRRSLNETRVDLSLSIHRRLTNEMQLRTLTSDMRETILFNRSWGRQSPGVQNVKSLLPVMLDAWIFGVNR